MELISIPTSEGVEILDLMRGNAACYVTQNTDYQKFAPVESAEALKGRRILECCAALLRAVRAIEPSRADALHLPDDWNLPDVEAALRDLAVPSETEKPQTEDGTWLRLRKKKQDTSDQIHRHKFQSNQGGAV